MSSNSPESRRRFLRWMAAAALTPAFARAACPCDGVDSDDDAKQTKAPATQPAGELRVCADPNNLPFSNRNHDGFEDKIAGLIAGDLGLNLTYDWLPQRLGFYRTALKTFDAQLVMAAPAGFDKALITKPYYRSSYVFVFRKDLQNAPRSFNDEILKSLKIGVQLNGKDTPATHALAKRNLIDNVSGYPVFDESEGKPAGKIIGAVANKEIDVAIVWGPQAGWCVKQEKTPLQVQLVSPEKDGEGTTGMPFTFEICMAVRRGETALRDRINSVIDQRQSQIRKILDDFSVPSLPLSSAEVTKA